MEILHIFTLAVVQGISEFLPISSSGHLLLMPVLTGWPDQGLTADVMMHVGSLAAIIAYFWTDIVRLVIGGLNLLRGRLTDYGKLALMILVATIPAVAFGLFLEATGWLDALRERPELVLKVVGWNAVIFGVILYIADLIGPRLKAVEDMRFGSAIIVGVAQMLALIPGTSRSGITMTAARMLGFARPEAARFSFLLGTPAIAGAGLVTTLKAVEEGVGISNAELLGAGFSFLASFAAIAFLMAVVKRMSFLPFVVYRLGLGAILLWVAYS